MVTVVYYVLEKSIEVNNLKISYRKLWILLAEKEMSRPIFRDKLDLSPATLTKLNKNRKVSLSVLLRICRFFDCNIGDICDAVPEESQANAKEPKT